MDDEIKLNFTFLAHGHRGLEGHPTWACTACGCVVAEQFLEKHYEACPMIIRPTNALDNSSFKVSGEGWSE